MSKCSRRRLTYLAAGLTCEVLEHRTMLSVSFQGETVLSLGAEGDDIVTADLNHDGNPDLITANQDSGTQVGSISVSFGDGHGGFSSPVTYSGFDGAASNVSQAFDLHLATGDFNEDGSTDVAVSSFNAGTITIFLNNGSGGLIQQTPYTLPGGIWAIAAGHFTGSAHLDLAAIDESSTSTIQLYDGHGDGTFTLNSNSTPIDGVLTTNLVAGNFGNGRDDLALSLSNAVNVSVFLSDPTAASGFDPAVDYAGGGYSLALGDMNGDHKLDIITSANGVNVLLGNGDGTFQSPIFSNINVGGNAMTAGDFDGDGKTDVAEFQNGSFYNHNSVQIFSGDGLGGVSLGQDLPVGVIASAIATADFNKDGKLDFVVPDDSTDRSGSDDLPGETVVVLSGQPAVGNTVSIADTTVQGHLGAMAEFTLTRAGDTSGFAAVNWSTSDGTATSFSDYMPSAGTVVFTPGDTSETLDVPIRVNQFAAASATFMVTLDSPLFVNIAGGGATATGTIDADIPLAPLIDVSTLLGVPVAIPILKFASDPMGEALTVGDEQRFSPEHGFVLPSDSGSIPGAPDGYLVYEQMDNDTTFSEGDSISYEVTNSDGYSAFGTASVSLNTPDEMQSAPVAQDFNLFVTQGIPVSIPVLNGNFSSDPDPSHTTVIVPFLNNPTSGGTLRLDDNGDTGPSSLNDTLVYTANSGFTGPDSFFYELANSAGVSTGQVNINVNSPGFAAPPQANNLFYNNIGIGSVVFLSVLNDSTQHIVPFSNHRTSLGGNVAIFIDSSGVDEFQYNAPLGVSGQDSFDYEITDGNKISNVATVFIQLSPQFIQTVSPIVVGTTTDSIPVDVLASATDFNGVMPQIAPFGTSDGTLTTSDGGTVRITLDQSRKSILDYTPPSGGLMPGQTDTFTYNLIDSTGGTGNGTVNVAYDRAPILANYTVNVLGGNPARLNVLEHAQATDSPVTNALLVTDGSDGSVSQFGSDLEYIPNDNVTNTDTVIVEVQDSLGRTTRATVTIDQTFEPAPIANDFSVTVPAGVTTPIDVLAHASGTDGDMLQFYGVIDPPANGDFGYDFDNPSDIQVDYTPNMGATTDSFTYMVHDGGGFATGTVTVNIGSASEEDLSGSADYYLKLDGSNVDVWTAANTSGPFTQFLLSGISSFNITATHSLTVDFSAGDPLPASGVDFSGPILNVLGSSADETTTVDNATVSVTGSFGAASINYSNTTAINFTGGGGNDVLTQNAQPSGGASLNFLDMNASDTINVNAGVFTFPQSTGPTVLGTLFIAIGAKGVVASPNTHDTRTVLELNTLSIAGSMNAWKGLLDLTGNDLLVLGGDAATISNQLQAGFNAGVGYWNGADGIISSTAAANVTFQTTLGNRTGGSDFNHNAGSPFDGVNTSSSDVLVKYTYFGDANLDGIVNGADYQLIDTGFGSHATDWAHGDFNYDRKVDGSDYSLIDNTFNQLTRVTAGSLAIIAPVLNASPAHTAAASIAAAMPTASAQSDNKLNKDKENTWADDVLNAVDY